MDSKQVEVPGISRREFLTYAWLGSIGLLMAEGVALMLRYGIPEPLINRGYGSIFVLDTIPQQGADPIYVKDGRFWLSHSDDGLAAFFEITTHLGCKYKWVAANTRFEDPCYGSKFELNGQYLEGPAKRSLDRFPIKIYTTEGTLKSNKAGDPIKVDPETVLRIEVDTGRLIKGRNRFI